MSWVRIDLICFWMRRRQWQPTLVPLPGKCHGRRSLVGCSPWGCYELDMTERLCFHFSLSCIGEGNGNPLQCSCLENPWTVEPGGLPSMRSQSRAQLKRLSNSSSKHRFIKSSSYWSAGEYFGAVWGKCCSMSKQSIKAYVVIDFRNILFWERSYLREKINDFLNNGHMCPLIESLIWFF